MNGVRRAECLAIGQALVNDGHSEGSVILELVKALDDRKRARRDAVEAHAEQAARRELLLAEWVQQAREAGWVRFNDLVTRTEKELEHE